jgi:hypothetical protein
MMSGGPHFLARHVYGPTESSTNTRMDSSMSFFNQTPNQEPQTPPVPEVEIKGQQAVLKDPTRGSEKRVDLPKTTWGAR